MSPLLLYRHYCSFLFIRIHRSLLSGFLHLPHHLKLLLTVNGYAISENPRFLFIIDLKGDFKDCYVHCVHLRCFR